jgi:predicted RND superfamily exporter protein
MNWRYRIESKFEQFSDFIFTHRKKTIALVLLMVLAMGTQLPNLRMDTSTEGFLHETDIMRLNYDKFRDQFGRDEKILVAVKTPDIFKADFLKKLARLHRDLETNLPYIDEVNSLLNARNTLGTKESLLVEDLFEDFKINEKELSRKKQLALKNPLLVDLLFDKSNTFTNIIIDTQTYSSFDRQGRKITLSEEDEFSDEPAEPVDKIYLTDEENTKIIEKIQAIVKKYEAEDFQVYLAGSALFSGVIKQAMKKDTRGFIQKMLVMDLLVLFLMFRRISGVFLPLLNVVLAIISTVSLMAFFKAPFTVVTQIMPSFLLAVITGGSIHLLAIFYKDFAKTNHVQDSLRFAMGHSGLAIVMTSLTTAAGMWSFSFSEVAPVSNLGKFASAGIVIGLLYILVLLPAMIGVLKIKHKPEKNPQNNRLDKFLLAISDFALNKAKAIVIVSTVMIMVAIGLAAQMKFSHYPLIWFDEQHPVRTSIEVIDKTLNGSMTMEVIVDTQKENGLYEPSVLKKIEQAKAYLSTVGDEVVFVGKTINVVDILKETNKALHANNADFYNIPKQKELIAQELFLFANSGSDDLEDFVDSQFSKARLTLKMPYVDAILFNQFIEEIDEQLRIIFADEAQVEFTGVGVLLSSIMEKSIHSSAISYLIAFGLIALMMIILIGDIKIGLISMIPNVLPILILVAIMSVFGLPLDMFSMLVGSIALGLAVDDTVHFMHNYRRYHLQGKSVDESVRLTMLGTGRAIIVTSVVLSLGFLVLLSASMNNMFNFGVLTASAIFVALIADFLLVPAIMKLLEDK